MERMSICEKNYPMLHKQKIEHTNILILNAIFRGYFNCLLKLAINNFPCCLHQYSHNAQFHSVHSSEE
jgi:hypothetical protein